MSQMPTHALAPPAAAIERAVRLALEEDAGRGDITTRACIPEDTPGEAVVRARSELVLCGLPVLREAYRQLDPSVQLQPAATDGARLPPGDVAARVHGPADAILTGERVALNFLQRLSGIASVTRRYVDALPPDAATRITDTRKTTPGLRALERYAVRCGHGHNHRDDLSAAVLIKDNHIAACGGLTEAVRRARAVAPHTSRIECEVDTLAQLREALDAGADILLLDNFDDASVVQAVQIVGGRALVEASGGIGPERVGVLARAGVDAISVGALTHSAPAADLALDWIG